ncbi:MAG TPA: type II secretion system F family protein [Actinomycetota bacterium]|jgi:tight adherence protein C|nr:type II secretion system F family protein [Actinomycetota bacterium]
MSWLISAGVIAAAALLVAGLLLRTDRVIRRRLGRTVDSRVSSRGLLVWIGKRIVLPRSRPRLHARLKAASVGGAAADRIIGAKVMLFAGGGLIGLTAWPVGELAAVGAAGAMAFAGFRLPDFLLARRAAALRRRVAHDIPNLLDLVSICVTAGLSPPIALERAAESTRGPLRDWLERARREVALGGSWRTALRGAADRLDLQDMRRLALALERGQRLGAPLADQLRRLAREVRNERRARAEERARRAPVLMLFPLVFLILPAFVLAAVIPAVVVATRGIP